LHRLEPQLAPDLAAAYHLPDMAQVRNPRHLKALMAGCQSFGVHSRFGCGVHGFERRGNRITGLRTDDGTLIASRYLIAAGAWTDILLQPLGWQLGIRPVRGQIALLNTRLPLFHKILLRGARYLVPRADGRVLVGSTEEHAGFDKQTTAQSIAELLVLRSGPLPRLPAGPATRCW